MTRSGEHAAARAHAAVPVSGSMESFYEEHWAAVVAVTASLCRDLPAAEEIAQESFLRAHQRWNVVSALDRPDLWVRRVALNLAVSRFRRFQSEARALARFALRRPPHNRQAWGRPRSSGRRCGRCRRGRLRPRHCITWTTYGSPRLLRCSGARRAP